MHRKKAFLVELQISVDLIIAYTIFKLAGGHTEGDSGRVWMGEKKDGSSDCQAEKFCVWWGIFV